MKRILTYLTLVLLAIVSSVVASLNAEAVTFNYYFSTLSLPLAALLFLAIVMGALAGVLLSLGMLWHARHEKAQLRRRLQTCEQEIKNLRDIPIKGPY